MNKIIFQIYHDKKCIPNYVKDNIIRLNPSYNYKLLDFNDGKELIRKYFKKKIAFIICNTIDSLKKYCHKSDLLRYCLLYLFAGVYLDVDLQTLIPIDEMIPFDDIDLICSFGQSIKFGPYKKLPPNDKKIHFPTMANGFLISKKKYNKLLCEQIIFIINLNNKNPEHIINCENLFKCINNECIKRKKKIIPYNKINIGFNIYIYRETCINKKFYFIDKNNKIIINSNNNGYL